MKLEINKFIITETPAQCSVIKLGGETSKDTEEQARPARRPGRMGPGRTDSLAAEQAVSEKDHTPIITQILKNVK